ncbi:MAG: proline--tRNA ligase, partial [Gemmatimonadota bacterium]
NKALQAGTSHYLGQNFSRAFGVTYQTEAGEHEYVWNTSWGVTTRLIGALVMTHGDDAGLRLPPKLAPIEVVIVPIYRSDDERASTLEAAQAVRAALEPATRVRVDDRTTLNPGAKYYEWEMKGVPLRIEIGPRDVAADQVVLVRRFGETDGKRKAPVSRDAVAATVQATLAAMQAELLEATRARRESNTRRGIETYDELRRLIETDAGFVFTGWCGSADCEAKAKEEMKAEIRVIPEEEFRSTPAPSTCVVCGRPSVAEVVWARAY